MNETATFDRNMLAVRPEILIKVTKSKKKSARGSRLSEEVEGDARGGTMTARGELSPFINQLHLKRPYTAIVRKFHFQLPKNDTARTKPDMVF